MNFPPRLVRFWRALKPWVLSRLTQPSTYAGLIFKVCAIVGWTVTDNLAGHVAEALAAVAGAALIAWDQKGDRPC